jgi:Leucine-rich repeat (LRR) protein
LGGLVRYDSFPALAELNLSENSFVDLTGIEFLGCLHTLNLSRNGIETLYVGGVEVQQGLNALPSLKTLDISYNQLVDLNGLQYANLKDLRGLLAHHNAINRIEHLDMLKSLHNLDLAANKVREIGHNSFPPGNDIRSVRLDDNLLINLTHLGKLGSIEVLSLSSNKIKETFEIEKIADLPKLRELNLKGNPMTRKV